MTSHRPSRISSKSKTLLHVILYLSAVSKINRTSKNVFFLIFRFQDIKKCRTSENNQKPPVHFKPSGIHFTETLSDKYSMSRPIQEAYFLGFPTLEKRRRKNAPYLSSPSPNVRRDKISRSGEPLTLTIRLIQDVSYNTPTHLIESAWEGLS